jgi:hypothetical protein
MKAYVHLWYPAHFFLEWEMFRTEIVGKNTHFRFNNFFFLSESLPVYEIIWKNVVHPDRPQITIWHVSFGFLITKATDTHSECVILIAFPRQQWLLERASVLRVYVHCLSCQPFKYRIKSHPPFASTGRSPPFCRR